MIIKTIINAYVLLKNGNKNPKKPNPTAQINPKTKNHPAKQPTTTPYPAKPTTKPSTNHTQQTANY